MTTIRDAKGRLRHFDARTCAYCGDRYLTPRYRPAKTCCPSHGRLLMHQERAERAAAHLTDAAKARILRLPRVRRRKPAPRGCLDCDKPRNVWCPSAERCLDVAIASSWPALSCGDCPLLAVDFRPALLVRLASSAAEMIDHAPGALDVMTRGKPLPPEIPMLDGDPRRTRKPGWTPRRGADDGK